MSRACQSRSNIRAVVKWPQFDFAPTMSSSALSSPEPTVKMSKTSTKITKVKKQTTKSAGKASKASPTHPSWKDIIRVFDTLVR
jgi:hypothetical protein